MNPLQRHKLTQREILWSGATCGGTRDGNGEAPPSGRRLRRCGH